MSVLLVILAVLIIGAVLFIWSVLFVGVMYDLTWSESADIVIKKIRVVLSKIRRTSLF